MKYILRCAIIALCLFVSVSDTQAQETDTIPVNPMTGHFGPPPPRDGKPIRMFNNIDPTQNAGKVEWSPRHIDMGTLAIDSTGMREMHVKNISKEDLQIIRIKTACHCAWAEWPTEVIKPGATATIKIYYHAENAGEIFKILSIQTNFDLEQWLLVTVFGEMK